MVDNQTINTWMMMDTIEARKTAATTAVSYSDVGDGYWKSK